MRQIIRQRIEDGAYAPENRLPSEEQLAHDLQVSRATVRSALAALASEGLVIRRQGNGTFVNTGRIQVQTHMDSLWEFTRLIEDSGRKPSIRPLALERRPATADEARGLHIAPGEAVISLVRLFNADQHPVIYSRDTLPQALLCVEPDESNMQLTIFELLLQYCQQSISYAVADLSAVQAGEEIAALLHVAPDTPLLHFVEVFYDRLGRPLVYGENSYNDKLLRLKIVHSKR
ncbi:MAG: GntR family transcriptional regulator [Chloroflexota bacterium]